MSFFILILVFTVAVIFSMLGLGGGVLYVPILLQSGLSFHHAVPTSLAIMLVMSLTAAVVYHTNELIDWRILFLLEPASILGAYIGSYNSNLFSEKFLSRLFAVVIFISAIFMLMPQKPLKSKPGEKFGFYHIEKNGEYYSINLWLGLPISFLAGFISSIIGIGGGFAKVPMMTLLFSVPIKIAVATSSAMIVITCFTGFLGHSFIGHVDYKLVGILSVIVLAGALIGSRISIRADKRFLNRLFAFLQFAIAIWMLFK